jgi:hypothetical protein
VVELPTVLRTAYEQLIEYQLKCQPFSTPESREAAQRRAREQQARVARETAMAYEEWQDVFYSTDTVGKAVLTIHWPIAGWNSPVCDYCLLESGDETESVPWPCATFLAVKHA